MYIKVYGILCLILAVSLGFYVFTKWQQYSGIKGIVEKNRIFIAELGKVVADEKSIYEDEKEGFEALSQEIAVKLSSIFPAEDDYTALTKQVDTLEVELASKNNPFEISILDYQDPVKTEKYSFLPLRMTIRSSAENFNKFLHLLENSGALSGQVRLMDVSSIRLNFQESTEGQAEIINFTVQLNAYFQ